MTWLVTGGAGYIGAHTVRRLRAAGHRVVVFDDLSTGLADRLPADVPLVVAQVTDRAALAGALRRYRVTGALHLAARKSVPESLARPGYYHRENVGGLATLLAAMADTGVRRLVFSSSAAVYGTPPTPLVTEATPAAPINPYGHTKLLGERLVEAAGRRHGISWLALRYFNAVGADAPPLADRGTTNLFPLVFRAVTAGEPVTVAGTDYPTPDGTPVRDYVHVADVAGAHLAAVAGLAAGPMAGVFNVGTGRGHSVLDVVAGVEAVTGRPVPYQRGPRRPGDPAEVVGDASAITKALGWTARHTLLDMISSAWYARPEPRRMPAA